MVDGQLVGARFHPFPNRKMMDRDIMSLDSELLVRLGHQASPKDMERDAAGQCCRLNEAVLGEDVKRK